MNLLPQYAAEGRIVRKGWSSKGTDGRELLCLYTAIAGNRRARPSSCPVGLMPQWLAYLLPDINDSGSKREWPRMVQRWVAVSDRLGLLVGERGDRLRSRWLAAVLRDAVKDREGDVLPRWSGSGVLVALERLERHGAGGEEVTEKFPWATPRSFLSRSLEDTLRGGNERSAQSAARELVLEISISKDSLPVRSCWDRIADALLTLIEKEVL